MQLMKKYIVTGSGGSIASEFIKKIYNTKDHFYLFYNNRKPNISNKKNIDFLKFNFKDSRKIYNFLSKKFNSKKKIIDTIIHFAASASPYKKINLLNHKDINEIYNINLFSPLLLFSFFINGHLKYKANKLLKIINISTTLKGGLSSSHYSHSKKSLDFYCHKLSENYSSKGILINTISPGFLDNDMYKNVKFYNKKRFHKMKIPNFLKKRGKNKDVINLIEFLLNDNNNYINGKVYEVYGGT
jgi:3-oxoacyl-[acyl-carrier protein] reductase